MKKTFILSLISCGLLASSAFAECSKQTCTKPEKEMNWKTNYTVTSKDSKGTEFYLDIKDIQRDIHVGVGSVNVNGERAADWSLGLGLSGVIYDNVYVGGNIDSEFVNVNGEDIVGVTGELKAGYVFENGLIGYGLVGAKGMNYSHDVNGVGFGAGLGVEYKVCPHAVAALEYKNYDMTMEGSTSDYGHESLGVKIKYLF